MEIGEKAKIQATAFLWDDSWGWSVQSDWRSLRSWFLSFPHRNIEVIAPAEESEHSYSCALSPRAHTFTHYMMGDSRFSGPHFFCLRLLIGVRLCVGGEGTSIERRWTTQVGRREEAKRGGKPGLGDAGSRLRVLHILIPAFPRAGFSLTDRQFLFSLFPNNASISILKMNSNEASIQMKD